MEVQAEAVAFVAWWKMKGKGAGFCLDAWQMQHLRSMLGAVVCCCLMLMQKNRGKPMKAVQMAIAPKVLLVLYILPSVNEEALKPNQEKLLDVRRPVVKYKGGGIMFLGTKQGRTAGQWYRILQLTKKWDAATKWC